MAQQGEYGSGQEPQQGSAPPDPPGPAGAVPPPAAAPVPAPPPPEAWQRPIRVETVPGTPYGLAILGPPAATSGPAVGALVAGIGAVLVATLVACSGLAGAGAGWGLWVAGAFAVLAGCLGVAGVGLAVAGIRQTRAVPGGTQPRIGGRRMAVTGLVCGAVGIVLTFGTLGVVALVQFV